MRNSTRNAFDLQNVVDEGLVDEKSDTVLGKLIALPVVHIVAGI